MAAEILTWAVLTETVGDMDETTVKAWLLYEVSTHKRASYITRLHQRYCKLRDAREREELLQGKLI